MAWRGKYKPRNPKKYIGDPAGIVYRSSMELKFFRWCDDNPSVIKWSSEEMCIPYVSPKDNRVHRYFPDNIIQKKNPDGTLETVMIEIKPASQSKPPVKGKTTKAANRYKREVLTWAVNEAKWKAAQAYCKDKGWTWQVLNEKHLGIVYNKGKKKRFTKKKG